MDGAAITDVQGRGSPGEIIHTNGVQVAETIQYHGDQIHTDPPQELEPQEFDLWRLNFEKLVKLLVTIGPEAMRQVFNNIHSPISLVTSLAQVVNMTTLRRLRAQGLISPDQWKTLYSKHKSQVNSNNFDANLVYVLLKNISPLTPPYPDGWLGLPLHSDHSLSADLVRVQWYRSLLVNRLNENNGRIEEKEHRAYWEQMKDVFVRLGGPGLKVKVDRLERERSPKQLHDDVDYVNELLEWDRVARDISAREARLQKKHGREGSDLSQMVSDTYTRSSRTSSSKHTDRQHNEQAQQGRDKEGQKQNQRKKTTVHMKDVTVLSTEEIRAHERTVILKFYRQLTETIQSDDVIPKLIQRSLLSHEEKNRITLSMRNSDRMKLVLELVSKKGGSAFDKFCDAIKYKYKKLSDQLIKAKESPFKVEKPDEASQCQRTLMAVYRTILKTITPIPWHPDIQVTLSSFLQPYYITDFYGRELKLEDILQPHAKCEKPTRILLEGFEGVGKSTLLRSLANQWVHGGKGHFLSRFKLVFLLDMKRITEDLTDTLSKQCLELGGYIRSENEISSLLEDYQEETLFLLDGYEDNNKIQSNIWDLIQRLIYRRSTIIMTSNSRFITPALLKNFDTNLVLLGLQPEVQEDMVQTYAKLTKTSIETYTGLLAKVVSEHNTRISHYALNPLYGLCLCLMSETGGNIDCHTNTFFMNSTLAAIQKLYCQTNDLKSVEEGVPDDIKDATKVLEKLAFHLIQEDKIMFSYRDMIECASLDNVLHAEMVLKLGLLVEVYPDDEDEEARVYAFVNRAFQEYLAARHLSHMESEDFTHYVDDLVGEKHLHRVAMYYCGIHRYDYNLRTINDLYGALSESNRRLCVASRRSTRDGVNIRQDDLTPQSEGRLSALSLCLECLAEGEGHNDILDLVKDSFPWRIYMKQKIHHSTLSLQGLAQVIKANMANITELEMHLDHIGMYQESYMLAVADAVEKNTHLVTLRLRWTNEDLLALFLANVFGKNRSLRNLHMMDDSHSENDEVSATVCSNLWSASNNMQHLGTVAFMYCKNPAMVTSIVRNIPAQLTTLYLNNCSLNLIGAQELMTKIEKSTCMQRINLASIRLKCSDFLYISYGLKRNKSLNELILSDVLMEENTVEGLAEALKFNTSLKRLELKRVTLNLDACRMLGNALNGNPTLMEVNLTAAEVNEDGARLLYRLKRDGILLSGLDMERIIGKNNYNPLDHSEAT